MSAPAVPPSEDLGGDDDLATQLTDAQRRAVAAERGRALAEERARHAEQSRGDAEAQLAEVVAELEILRGGSAPRQDSVDGDFSLFQDQLTSQPSLAADGSDPGVLPIALGGTALVGFMVVVLTTANGRLFQPFGIAMVAITAALAYFAWQTRVERIEVQISDGGVVYVERSSTGALRFDLRSTSTHVSMTGAPGTTSWELTFTRGGGLDPFTVTGAMVDSTAFVERVRTFRPDL